MEMFMHRLRAIYGSLSSPQTLVPETLSLSQNELVAALMDEHFEQYPPSIEYQKRFWRHVVTSIEESGEVSRQLPETLKLSPKCDHNDWRLRKSMNAYMNDICSYYRPLRSYNHTVTLRNGSSE